MQKRGKFFQKRGVISISFSMIFSVILIIAIIGVSFYAINYFLNLGKCAEISLFYQGFQNEIDEAWSSEIARTTFVGKLPGDIESVCFRESGASGVGKEYEASEDYFRTGGNMFLYPPERACNQVLIKAKHIDLTGFGWGCFSVRDNRVEIPIEKGSFDALVKIKRN